MITPVRMMAPIGKEVVLVAGLFGTRGQFEPRQPIEWTLTNESVGYFITAGDQKDCFKRILHSEPNKKSGTYAVTKTSTSGRVITRGTPARDDDLTVLSGQTWTTISSPREGTSYVSVLAPDAENWDQRRKTATIHWVDVQWTLPPSAAIKANEPHTMTTLVTKASGKPLAGWIVRYELIGDSTNIFGPGSQNAVESMTDANGQASIQLSAPNKTAAAQMEVKIIRPSMPDDDLPRTVVGRGYSTITWSAPDPKVTLYAPQSAAIGSTMTYRAEVSNAGDVMARQLVASASIPPNMTYLKSDPPARVVGNQLTWELGDMQPGVIRSLNIQVRPDRNATVRFCVRVDSADQMNGDNLWAEACYETRVFSSSLAVEVTGPQQADINQPVTYDIHISNTGMEPVTGIVIQDRLPSGLEGPTGHGTVLRFPLDEPLAPGKTRTIPIQLTARQEGKLCHTVDVTGDGGHSATTTACVTAVRPAPQQPIAQPALNVTLAGPHEGTAGETVQYNFGITNAGNVPQALRILLTFDTALSPTEATPGFDRDAAEQRAQLIWYTQQIAPGASLTRTAKFELTRESPGAWVRLQVDAMDGSVTKTQEARIVIRPRPASNERPPMIPEPTQPDPTAGDPAQITGELLVSVSDMTDPVRITEKTSYIVTIQNGRNVSDKNIDISIEIPRGLEFLGVRGPRYITAKSRSPDGSVVVLNRISELRAGDELDAFYIDVRGTEIGGQQIKVRVTSFRSPIAVEATEDTMVNAAG